MTDNIDFLTKKVDEMKKGIKKMPRKKAMSAAQKRALQKAWAARRKKTRTTAPKARTRTKTVYVTRSKSRPRVYRSSTLSGKRKVIVRRIQENSTQAAINTALMILGGIAASMGANLLPVENKWFKAAIPAGVGLAGISYIKKDKMLRSVAQGMAFMGALSMAKKLTTDEEGTSSIPWLAGEENAGNSIYNSSSYMGVPVRLAANKPSMGVPVQLAGGRPGYQSRYGKYLTAADM